MAPRFPALTTPGEADAFVAARGVFVVPTLSVLYAACGRPDAPGFRADAETLKHVRPQFRTFLEMPVAARVPILAGTDAPATRTTYGVSLHKELEHLVAAGMTPTAALAAATSAVARAFRLSDRGRISAGMRADLLLVEGDPSSQIRAARNIVAIWKRGVRLDRPQ